MKKFKILIPIDGSEGSRHSLDMAKKMADKFDARLILFNAVDLHATASPYFVYDKEIIDSMKKSSERFMEEVKMELKDYDCETVVALGKAGELIVQFAEENDLDLIVMATRGLGAVGRFFVGSVTTYVLHHSPIPVMSIPMHAKK